jgi:uncharacterized membrane protein YhhN
VTTAAWGLLAVAVVFAVADWVAVAAGNKRLEYVAKPAVMVALVGVALALDPASEAQRAWFVGALALSMAGDVFLMLPRDRFVPGLAAFLLAHVAYIAGFAAAGFQPAALGAGVAIAAGAGVLLGRRVLAAAGALRMPVAAYMVVLGGMLAAAYGSGRPVAAVGATLFFASDTLIGWRRFVTARPWMDLVIIVTYHAGQALLVLSLIA